MDTAYVRWKFPLDTLDGGHVSKSHTHKILNPRLIVQVGDLSLIWIWTNYIKLICLIYL